MGTTDSNGIYFYEDTDPVSPLHTLLNRGQDSVAQVVTDLKDDPNIQNGGVQGVMVGATPPPGAKIIEKNMYIQLPATAANGIATVSFPDGPFPNGVINAHVGLSLATGAAQSALILQTGAVTTSLMDVRVAAIVNGVPAFQANARPWVSITIRGW